MRRTILLSGICSFIMAFLGGMLAVSLAGPAWATAQSAQLEEVRASAFTLVAEDGTVLARLGAGNLGGGNLTLSDGSGMRRVAITSASGGAIATYASDGATINFKAGLAAGGADSAPVNGVLLGPGGSVSALLPSP
jgi:hypothetical protein